MTRRKVADNDEYPPGISIMVEKNVLFMLARTEAGGQHLQRRCFVASSIRNKRRVNEAVSRLRSAGLFAYDFSAAEFSFSERDWGGLTYEEARQLPETRDAARSDIEILRSLGIADFLLVLLPAGFSAGWETGYAACRGAHIVVCTEGSSQVDLPLLHADRIFRSLYDSVQYIISSANGS